jgi:hypothetical protein
VARLVEGDACQAVRTPRRVRAFVDGGRIERPAGAARDNERGRTRIVDELEVRGEQRPQRARQRDDADGGGGVGRDGRLGLVAPGVADVDLCRVEVDVAPAKRGDLARAQPGVGGEAPERPVVYETAGARRAASSAVA